jgi:DHA2 family multidrug resistance protein-like MFS transporter
VAIAAPVAGRLADRFPAAILGGVGLAVMATGLILLAAMAPGIGHADIAWRMAVCGIGFGLFQAPNNRILLGSAPRPRAGAAGGMLGTARQVGQSLGAVGVALCFRLAPSSPTVWAVGAAAGAAGLAAAVSMTRLLPRPR